MGGQKKSPLGRIVMTTVLIAAAVAVYLVFTRGS